MLNYLGRCIIFVFSDQDIQNCMLSHNKADIQVHPLQCLVCMLPVTPVPHMHTEPVFVAVESILDIAII